MRKALYIFYTILASYPVILLLVLVTAGVIYLGTGYRPIEARYEALLEKRVELKRERQRLAEELEGMRQGDLRKRLEIFSNEFLADDEIEEKSLLKIPSAAFAASGWSLNSVEVLRYEEPEEELGLGLIVAGYNGRSERSVLNDGSSFLPSYALLQACTYLWRKSPTKDFSRIKIERDANGYSTRVEIVYPLGRADDREGEQ